MKKIIKYIVLVVISQNIYGQISPGELSNVHKNLEGMSNCTQCHILGEKIESKKCLTCHSEIKSLIKSGRGYHGSVDIKNKECSKCHGEHFGRDFEIIRFNEKEFDHSQTTFKLNGKHSEAECRECHKPEFIQIDSLKLKSKTFLGLKNDCQSCHEDYHKGTLSSVNCVDCHNTDAWRPAPKFLHDKSKFKLRGAHQNVDCEKCHVKEIINDKEFQKFTGLEFATCTNCHTDIHKGKFGTNCLKCHTIKTFRSVKNIKSFDHSQTNFKLIGKHENVACNKCHIKSITAKLNHKKCTNCHSDFHEGVFVANNTIQDCSDCHDEFSFTPSHYTIQKHNFSKFKLAGSHFAVPCNECHFVESKWKFRFKNNECETCHEDIHKSSLNYESGLIANCETCHTTEKWNRISFNHSKTEFELVGEHANISCSKCHFTDQKLEHQFVEVSKNCKDCHSDIHAEQFMEKYKNNCAECHSPLSWVVENFNHSNTRFIIDGAHKDVQCVECHKVIKREGKNIIQYKFEDISCKNCHTS